MQAVQFDSISKEFPGHLALKSICFSIQKGQIHGLLGPNGAGKSTLMNILAGILPASSGRVHWAEGSLRVGFLPEHSPLYTGMQVEEFLLFAAQLKGVDATAEIPRVFELCQLQDVRNRLIQNLSRGYRQRVNLAQALLNRPELLILDEPFIGLDPQAIGEMRQLFIGLKGSTTVLFSSHQLQEVENICDELTIMHKGQVLASGPLEEILDPIGSSERFSIRILKKDCDWCEEIKKISGVVSAKNLSTSEKDVLIEVETLSSDDIRPHIVRELVARNGDILELYPEERHLDEVFDQMVRGVKNENI